MTNSRFLPGALAALIVLVLAPSVLEAQGGLIPRGTRPADRPAAGSSSGIEVIAAARLGFDLEFQDPLLGGVLRAVLPLPLRPMVQATGDLTFFNRLTDRGAGLEVLVSPLAGLSVGGGPAWRSSIFPGESGRTQRTGWSAVVLLGGTRGPRRAPPGAGTSLRDRLVTGIEFRYANFDGYAPQQLALQLGFALR